MNLMGIKNLRFTCDIWGCCGEQAQGLKLHVNCSLNSLKGDYVEFRV